MSRHFITLICLLLVVLMAPLGALAQPSLNHVLRAVPAPGPVTVDGSVGEWDLSGQIWLYPDRSTRDVNSVRIAAMYDDEALYLSGVRRDLSPMVNRLPYKPDRGDCLIIFMQTDVAWRIDTWYYTIDQKPLLRMNASRLLNPHLSQDIRVDDPRAEGVEATYRKDADGQGYVHELKLPWSVLFHGEQRFMPGARFAMLFGPRWSFSQGTAGSLVTQCLDLVRAGADRPRSWMAKTHPSKTTTAWGECVLEPQGNLPQSTPQEEVAERLQGVVPITVEVPRSAKTFTIAIDDAAGKRVRNLIEDTPVKQYQISQEGDSCTVEVMWDGLDDDGNPVEPGTYRVKGLSHEGLDVTYMLSYYNPGDPPWQIGDGTGDWGSDHACPTAVACGGRHSYVGWHHDEGGCPVLGINVDTMKKIWHGQEESRVYGDKLAASSKYLFCAHRSTAKLARRDPDTGALQKTVELSPMLFTKQVMTLPLTARFKLDPAGVGLTEKWYEKADFSNWDAIRTDTRWQDQGYDYHGVAWYAIEFEYPASGLDDPITFHFGAVDGLADLYMDGRKFAEQKRPPVEMWDKPFARSLGGPLSPGKHVMVVRVEKREYFGGVWKPILVMTQGGAGGKISYQRPTGLRTTPHGVGNQPDERDHFYAMEGGLRDIAANEELVAVSLGGNDRIILVDAESMGRVGDLYVKSPDSLDFGPDGLLYVVTRGRIVRFNVETGQRAAARTPGVGKFGAIAVDDVGNIYVADLGPDMQVKVFDKRGNLIRTAGVKGGRPDEGRFDPQGMRFMSSIDVDANGNIWVCESDDRPRRISVWGKDGRLVKDFIGNTRYHGTGGLLHPTDPTIAFGDGMEFKLNYQTQEWELVSTMWRQREGEYFGIWPVYTLHWYCDGGQFITSDASGKQYDYWIDYSTGGHTILMREGDHWTPVCAIGEIRKGLFDTSGTGIKARGPFVGHEIEKYYWFDENRDGKPQPAELQFFRVKWTGDYNWWWDQEVLADLNLYVGSTNGLHRLNPVAWTDYGAPRYDFTKAELVTNIVNGRTTVYEDGFISRTRRDAIEGLNKDGELIWTYPHKYPGWEAKQLQPGDLHKILRVSGVVDMGPEVGKVFSLRAFSHEDFLTTDGLYISQVFKHIWTCPATMPDDIPAAGTSINNTSMTAEPFSGWLGRAADGKVRLLTGDHDWRVCEVLGLDTIKRFGPYESTVAEQDAAAAQQLVDRRTAAAEAEAAAATLTIERMTPSVDGQLGEWPEDGAVAIESLGETVANAWIGYDDTNLYLAYEVADDSPMINTGKSAPWLFKTGDCVDFQLATNPEANKKRKAPAVGDIRVLISVMNDEPIVVLYRPVVDAGQPKNEVEFTSFWSLKLDDVHIVASANIKIVREEGSYTVEAAIPLAELRWQPQAGQQLRGDVGAIFSDAAGMVNLQRVYWANKETVITSDAPSEAKLRPDLWGLIKVQ